VNTLADDLAGWLYLDRKLIRLTATPPETTDSALQAPQPTNHNGLHVGGPHPEGLRPASRQCAEACFHSGWGVAHEVWRYRQLHEVLHTWRLVAAAHSQPGDQAHP
jgi:hypothetical protein